MAKVLISLGTEPEQMERTVVPTPALAGPDDGRRRTVGLVAPPPRAARPPAQGRPTRRRAHHQAADPRCRRGGVRRRGFDGASLVDIAGAAGVTTGAVYSHFRGKPELLLDVVASTLDAIDPLRRVGPDAVGPAALHEWMAWLLDPDQAQLRSLIAEINHAGARDAEVRPLLLDYSGQYVRMHRRRSSRAGSGTGIDARPTGGRPRWPSCS